MLVTASVVEKIKTTKGNGASLAATMFDDEHCVITVNNEGLETFIVLDSVDLKRIKLLIEDNMSPTP